MTKLLDNEILENLIHEPTCEKCGSYMEWANCWNGCDDGYFDAYEDDPMWYEPGDTEKCAVCNGQGGWWECDVCASAG